MNTSQNITYVGVDVSKDFLDVFSLSWKTTRRFPNSLSGASDLLCALQLTDQSPHLILESTGGYEKLLRSACAQASVLVSMINPRQARDFAKASGTLAKTDSLDARILASFGHTFQPSPTPLPPKILQKLKCLVRRRFHLNELRIQEQSQLEKCDQSSVRKEILSLIKTLQNRITKLEQSIIKLMDEDPDLAAKRKRLEQIKGVGPVVSATLLSELPELGSLDNPQVTSLCGLAPFNRDSGKHKGKRTILGGRGRIRRTLYMPTLCAIQHNPPLNHLYHRLKANGKPGKVAITAAMRKLICLLNRMIADPQFQPQ